MSEYTTKLMSEYSDCLNDKRLVAHRAARRPDDKRLGAHILAAHRSEARNASQVDRRACPGAKVAAKPHHASAGGGPVSLYHTSG